MLSNLKKHQVMSSLLVPPRCDCVTNHTINGFESDKSGDVLVVMQHIVPLFSNMKNGGLRSNFPENRWCCMRALSRPRKKLWPIAHYKMIWSNSWEDYPPYLSREVALDKQVIPCFSHRIAETTNWRRDATHATNLCRVSNLLRFVTHILKACLGTTPLILWPSGGH